MVQDQVRGGDSHRQGPRRRPPFVPRLKWLAVVAAVVAVLALLMWARQMLDQWYARKETTQQFMWITAALFGYAQRQAEIAYQRSHPPLPSGMSLPMVPAEEGRLPFPVRRAGQPPESWYLRNGEGEPLHSWRVDLLPYVESLPPWDIQQHWNSPVNRELFSSITFFSYNPPISRKVADTDFLEANALAITGPGTAFGDGKEPPKRLKDVPPDIILVVEVRASGIPWPAPGDFDVRTMPQTINAPDGKSISSWHEGGFHVIFGDLSVWFLSDNVPFETLRKFFTVAGAARYDREALLNPYALDKEGYNWF